MTGMGATSNCLQELCNMSNATKKSIVDGNKGITENDSRSNRVRGKNAGPFNMLDTGNDWDLNHQEPGGAKEKDYEVDVKDGGGVSKTAEEEVRKGNA